MTYPFIFILILIVGLFLQDPLENFFSQLRGLGGQNVHPTAVDAMQRIRLILIGENAEDLVSNPAVQSTPEVHMLGNNDCGPFFTKEVTADVSEPVQQDEVDDVVTVEEA